jgi:tetratricopeptide (TPR) repeat protein
MRLLHAQAQTFRRTDPEKYRELLFQSAALCDVRNTNPALLVEFGNAYIDADKTKEGEAMLRDTLRWNPRAIQKDKILAALGKIELERGNEQAALDYFTRFEKENLGSSIFGETMLAKAKLHHKRNQRDVTRRVLEEVLKSDATRGDIKAEALLLLGESHMAANDPKPAIAYFQRIYVMYGRWKPWVAKAYLQSGQGFEKLNDTESARRTYQELATHPDLEDFPETTIAKARLDALGGPLPSDKQSSSAPASTTPAEE